jgi:hypothetical protein
MNSIPSREFQLNYQRLDEPVTVMARSRTLGTWYPKGTEPDFDNVEAQALLDEIAFLKSELAKRRVPVGPRGEESLRPVQTFTPAVAVRATTKNGSLGFSKERQLGAKGK